jgi:hypothetical protein
MSKEIICKKVEYDQPLRFIGTVQISIAPKIPGQELHDPKTDAILKAHAICLEHNPGGGAIPRPKDRSFIIDLDKKIFFWGYTGGKYEAVNHDEMFKLCVKRIQEALDGKNTENI